jgi:hypothetical protein
MVLLGYLTSTRSPGHCYENVSANESLIAKQDIANHTALNLRRV